MTKTIVLTAAASLLFTLLIVAIFKEHPQPIKIDYVNVLDFGADPTGQCNSTEAIQEAVNTGKDIFIPKGFYIIDIITIKGGQSVSCEDSTIIIKSPK